MCVCIDVNDGGSQVGFLSTKLKQGRSLRTFSRRNSMQNTDEKKEFGVLSKQFPETDLAGGLKMFQMAF